MQSRFAKMRIAPLFCIAMSAVMSVACNSPAQNRNFTSGNSGNQNQSEKTASAEPKPDTSGGGITPVETTKTPTPIPTRVALASCLVTDPAAPQTNNGTSKLGWDGINPLGTAKFNVTATE